MAKRLSDQQKEKIIEDFINGKSIQDLSDKYSFTKLTISRNLKRKFGDQIYKELVMKNKSSKGHLNKAGNYKSNDLENTSNKDDSSREENINELNNEKLISNEAFFEIAPLDLDIDNEPQKDLSSIPIKEITFPKVVYMIVDNKIELISKYLKDYPEWQFLSNDDLVRKTLKIYYDLKIAKRECNRDQKVIKIPNPNVLKVVAPILLSRGISRLVSSDSLISL